MKIAVSGKGGAGKTTVSSLLCRALEAKGREVIAVDADSNPNLACALGVPDFEKIIPLAEMKDLIREKTGAEKGSVGAYFKMNPDVSDIPERFRHSVGKVQLLVMGSVTRGNSGCACPEYVLIRSLISYLLLNRDQDMVIDMEAGLEHLGRGVTEKVDVLFVVVRPNRVSGITASRICKLARDMNIKNILAIGNGIRNERDKQYLQQQVRELEFAGFFPDSDMVRDYDREGKDIFTIQELRYNADKLIAHISETSDG